VEQRLDKLEAVLALGTNEVNEVAPLVAELLSIPTAIAIRHEPHPAEAI